MAGQALPTRFPCWCKAVYSWGGETKRDLGFIEGDLIEVINAGDGSWWMGRLKRDRRMVGLFPSNFVELLSEDYQPWNASRNGSSEAISRQNSAQAQAQAKPVPQKQKSMFRKPFTAYAAAGAPNPAAAARERLRAGGQAPTVKTTKPFSSMKRDSTESRESASPAPSRAPTNLHAVTPRPATKRPATSPANANVDRHGSHARTNSNQPQPYQTHASRAVSPAPPPSRQSSHTRTYQQQSRAVSPAPPRAVSPAPPPQQQYHRAVSPAPPRQQYQPRAVSPAPPSQYRAYDRGPSPSPYSRSVSPAPPSRHGSYARGHSPAPPAQYQYQPRGVSPAPPPQRQYNRAVSPAPPPQHQYSRAVSPAPPRQYQQRAVSPAPPSQYRAYDRGPSPSPYQRGVSPAPSFQGQPHSRAVSPAPSFQQNSRAPSPAPSFQYRAYDRGPSPSPYQQQLESRSPSPAPPQFQNQYNDDEEDDGPPPPPPPHRVAYDPNRAISPAPPPQDRFTTPEPPSPNPKKFTPSPLTNAMNDVMSSLQDMASPEMETPSNPWSPDALDQVHQASARMAGLQTGNASGSRMGDEDDDGPVQGPPDVDDYVKRMESRLRRMHQMEANKKKKDDLFMGDRSTPPPVPTKDSPYQRPGPSSPMKDITEVERKESKSLRHRKSVHDLGKSLGRSFTSKTNSTTATQSTNRSLMSGYSATAMSSTSAGSYYRKKFAGDRSRSAIGDRPSTGKGQGFGFDDGRPESPFTGVTYHSSHASQSRPGSSDQQEQSTQASTPGAENPDPLGGLTHHPKARRSGFFRKMIDSAKTQAANARSTMETISRPASRAASRHAGRAASRAGSRMDTGTPAGFAGGSAAHQSTPSRDGGLGTTDWVQVRRDVNRSNSLSKNEREERAERCHMMDYPALNPVDILNESVEGDEGLDGLPIAEPIDFAACSLAHVDKGTRFINSIPLGTTSAALAQGYVCRPFRSDVQRLRAIFTWVSERITWEEDFEGEMDTRHVLQSKRGCSQEIAMVVAEMCASVGLHAEVVRGYLKTPGEPLDLESVARPNHTWNAVIVDGEWRMMDCSLAGPTNPKRVHFSCAGSQVAESWYFLARPLEICYSHVPLLPEQQHICPSQPHDILMALPCATPTYFKHGLRIVDFDTSMLNLDNLEMAHVYVNVPEDVECVAEVEARSYSQDADGDYFESGDFVRKPALAQVEWVGGQKRYTIKALLPGDEGAGVLKIFAGPRGLMHSNKQNPHTLAIGLPMMHTGSNPPYSFLTLHPTPHAQRHDLYVAQPQCSNLVLNNTFVFCVRQHPSSTTRNEPATPLTGRASPNPFARPASAMSMQSISATGSNYTNPSQASSGSNGSSGTKPAKLAIQTPSGKIIRLTRKSEHVSVMNDADGTAWETVIKIGEKGTWRGLVLADRSARWCVFSQWECA